MSDETPDNPERASGVDPRLLEILICPVSRQPLSFFWWGAALDKAALHALHRFARALLLAAHTSTSTALPAEGEARRVASCAATTAT